MKRRRARAAWAGLSTLAAIGGALATIALPALAGAVVGDLAHHRPADRSLAVLAVVLLADAGLAAVESLADASYVVHRIADLRRHAGTRALERLRRGPGTALTDAEKTDAGETDAGETDAGETDADETDADETDADKTDVDETDAEPRDADVTTRLLEDAAQAGQGMSLLVSLTLSAGSGIVALVALARIDWWLVPALLATILMFVQIVRRFVLDTSATLADYRAGQSELAGRLMDAQVGAASIQAHGTWRRERARVLAPLTHVRSAGESLWRAQSGLAWRIGIALPAAQLVTIVVAGLGLHAGRLDVGQFTAALGYSGLVLAAIDGLETAAGWNLVRVGRRRVSELADAGRFPTGTRHPAPHRPPRLHLAGVSVHDHGSAVLDDVHLDLPAGSFTIVTSDSPPARATLAGVLTGAVRPSAGRIRLAGIDLDEIAPHRLEQLVSRVLPRPALLGDTVGGLIGLRRGRLPGPAGDDHLRAAAERARIHAVIESLPDGFATPLADLELSGGEVQRLGIAQALAGDAPVLVFEDATSSLDAATEREVFRALLAAAGGRTSVLITNRPVPPGAGPRVMRLADGRLTELTSTDPAQHPTGNTCHAPQSRPADVADLANVNPPAMNETGVLA